QAADLQLHRARRGEDHRVQPDLFAVAHSAGSQSHILSPFFQVTLRTLDAAAAKAFYASVFGAGVELDIVPLHEQAIARGAKPHWLGFIDVGEVDRAAVFFSQRGSTAYGPKWINPIGLEAAVLRDPGGAM